MVAPPSAGLCVSCLHGRRVPNSRGSIFSLCERSRTQPEVYPRYPRLPVLACLGYQPSSDGGPAPRSTPR